jgi:hypothetical protein
MSTQYSFTLPPYKQNCETISFGIGNGSDIVRIKIFQYDHGARGEAEQAAAWITELLNEGREYGGPKTLTFDRKHRYTCREAIESLFS